MFWSQRGQENGAAAEGWVEDGASESPWPFGLEVGDGFNVLPMAKSWLRDSR